MQGIPHPQEDREGVEAIVRLGHTISQPEALAAMVEEARDRVTADPKADLSAYVRGVEEVFFRRAGHQRRRRYRVGDVRFGPAGD